MDNKLLLVKSITLLYRESIIPGASENSSDTVRTVLQEMKLSDVNLTVNHERDVLVALKETALEMCNNPLNFEYEPLDLLQRLKMNCGGDEKLFDSFAHGIEPELSERSLKQTVLNIRKSLNNHFRTQKVDQILFQAASSWRYRQDKINSQQQFIAELLGQLEPFQVDAVTKDPAIISEVDIGDETGTSQVFKEIKDVENGDGIMKCGYQGINRMLQGGFRRGDAVVIGALQHKYKTGFSLSLFKQFALYNKPYMRDPTKKPMLLRISFEDSSALNLQFLYQSIMENETGKKAVLGNATDEQMSAYIKEKLEINGFHVRLLRVDPTLWTYRHICNKVLEYEAQGYEVQLLMLDYLAMVPTTGCAIGPMGSDLRDMYRRMRNFCSPKGITLITPHQLSTEAKQLIRDGRADFVKEIAEKGYYDKCKTIDNEVDIELYIHIEKHNKQSYLTVQRGKHRLPTIIPDELKYIVLPFHDVGGVRDDFGKADSTCRKVGGGPIGGGNEIPYWEADDRNQI